MGPQKALNLACKDQNILQQAFLFDSNSPLILAPGFEFCTPGLDSRIVLEIVKCDNSSHAMQLADNRLSQWSIVEDLETFLS